MASEVWIFFSDLARGPSLDTRNRVRRVCGRKGWQMQERPWKTIRSAVGRPLEMVDPGHGEAVYRRSHRTHVAVLTLGGEPVIPLHPNADYAMRRGLLKRLNVFVRYKAFASPLLADDNADDWVGRFEAWCDGGGCENEYDPRCLPFHVFRGNSETLHEPPGRTEFDRSYGGGNRRTDEEDSHWLLSPQIFHGHDVLHVAGCALPRGFHWDVQAQGRRIATPAAVWQVDRYINVFPDAHLLGRHPYARRVE